MNALSGKVGPEFASRLTRLRPGQKVRAVVLLNTPTAERKLNTRPTREERQAVIESIRNSAPVALRYIDEILERFNGKRLTEQPSAIGALGVETTSAGISALAESPYIKAILEDQAISSRR
jgi:hypothetical protein